MTQDHSSVHQKGTDLKHQGQKDQAIGTMKKVAGALIDDKGMQAKGEIQKEIGDAERTTGKFVENAIK